MRRNITFAVLYLSLAFLFALVFSTALAEGAINRIDITAIDYDSFPQIVVQAVIRDENNDPVPSSDLSPDQGNIELLESGQLVDYSFQQISTGVETMIVVDTETKPEYVEVILQELVTAMKTDDSIGIILTNSQGNEYIRPLTKDKQVIRQVVESLNISGTGVRLTGVGGIQLAYDELIKSLNYQEMVQSVVLVSSGLHSMQSEDITAITSKAKEINAPLHVVSAIAGTFGANQMIGLTEDVGGIFVDYSSGSLSPLPGWLDKQRVQYQFAYRSELSDSSDRSIELRTKSGNTSDVVSYQVDISSPLVVIDSPPNNIELIREAVTYEIGQTAMDGVEPTNVDVQAHIEWPDGYPRAITQAQFFLDNTTSGSPITYPGESINFSWNLRPYHTKGANPVQLRVQVQDELGLESISQPVTVKVTVIIPDPPTPIAIIEIKDKIENECADLSGFDLTKCKIQTYTRTMFSEPSGWISIGSMLIAIAAIIFAFRFRGQIAERGGDVVNIVRQTLTRLTRPGHTEAGAYLEVLRGDDELQGKKIPLYINTVTPAGRSPQEAELVFQLSNDRSVISRRHCEFSEENGIFKVRDHGSSHGTYVNGVRLPEGGEGHVLSDSDKIELGPAERGGVLLRFSTSGKGGFSDDEEQGSVGGGDELYQTTPAYSDDEYDY